MTDTHGVWRVDDIKAGYTALLVKDGILYVVADTGNLYAFDAKTGEQLWVYNLGTVGKGSPVWADGKIYVMEVNGNIHIVRPSRDGCERLSHVVLDAADGNGKDEIYASPAIADGCIYLVTRDRTICISDPDKQTASEPIPQLPAETPGEDTVAKIQLVPFETRVSGGGEIQYELRTFDKNGRYIETLEPELEPQADLPGATAEGGTLSIAPAADVRAGHVVGRFGDLTATARLRVFPDLPWKWDFEGFTGKQVPFTWIAATGKLAPVDVDGSTALHETIGRGKPSAIVWIGPPDMTGYSIQADVMMREEKRRLPSIGIIANRYDLIMKGNVGKLSVQSWAPHLRMAKEIRFRSDPDVWYTMKLNVDIRDDGAHVRGKVWKRGEAEPDAWTIEALDPHPNQNGSPGLYVYALADCFFDNVIVTKE